MLASSGNLFDAAPGDACQEVVASILNTPDLKIERIVSLGQHSPLGFWYDQPLLLAGSAVLSFRGETEFGSYSRATTY